MAAAVPAAASAAATSGPLGGGALGVRKQYQLTGRFDGNGHVTLMLGAVARHPAGPDLAAVAHVLAEHPDVLVIDPFHPVLAEGTRLLLDSPPGVLGGPPGGTSTIVVACHD